MPTTHPSSAPRWQAPGQPERTAKPAPGLAAPASLREHTPADVSPRGEHACQAEQGDEGDGEQAERPPAVATERAHLLAPSDRGQPGRPGARHPQIARVDAADHVPNAAQQECNSQNRRREAVRSPRTRRER
jgi:hypothetical protein